MLGTMAVSPGPRAALLAATLSWAAAGGCSTPRAPAFVPPGPCVDAPAGVLCEGSLAFTCDGDGAVDAREDCAADGGLCVDGSGCAVCAPAQGSCDGNVFRRCNGDGTDFDLVAACDDGTFCSASGCADLCAEAAATSSYLGCSYHAVPTANVPEIADEGFAFAVVVANTQLVPAEVTVRHPGLPGERLDRTIPPGQLVSVELPFIGGLEGPSGEDASSWRSHRVADGAYRVTSNVPVTVYQFNPLEFQRGLDVFSNTNDASLLLPTHVLTGRYLGVSRPTQLLRRRFETDEGEIGLDGLFPGFLAVVGVSPEPADVTITAAGFIAGGLAYDDGGGDGEALFPPLAPGETAVVRLEEGDVLQLLSQAPEGCPGGFVEETSPSLADGESIAYCNVGPDYDLTGTRIEATQPVQVLGGHQCTFVPFDRWACDHLEESLFPLETWGTNILVPAPETIRNEPFLARVIAAEDGTTVRSNPSTVGLDATLDAGEFLELEARQDFVVEASGPVMVAQFLVGQDFAGFGASLEEGPDPVGDPSMSVAIPREQLRPSYAFLAPVTFTENWITVLAAPTAVVRLDDVPLPLGDGVPVGDSPFQASRVEISGGVHRLEADELVGLVVHGYASYTSYMLPGGLDFEDLGLLR